MAVTYDQLGQVTLTSAASSLYVTSINNTYTDLRISFYCPGASTNYTPRLTFGGVGLTGRGITADYYNYQVTGSNFGNEVTSLALTKSGEAITSTIPFSFVGDVMAYSQTSKGKIAHIRNGYADSSSDQRLNRLFIYTSSTAAISQVGVLLFSGNFNIGTQLAVWGIKKA